MKIYFSKDNIQIEIPEYSKNKKWEGMNSNSSYLDFIFKKKTDVQKEMGCFLSLILTESEPKIIYDFMSGIGITAKFAEKYYSKSKLHLGDLSSRCAEILKYNFPNKDIWKGDGLKRLETIKKQKDSLAIIDFNNLSWKTYGKWERWFELSFEKFDRLWYTDSSIYGLTKFGKSNFKTYGIENLNDYWILVKKWLLKKGWKIKNIAYFNNAAFISCDKTFKGDFKILEWYPRKCEIIKKGLL
jgi:hypothetical protein